MVDETYAAALRHKLRLSAGQRALALGGPTEYDAALCETLGVDAVATEAVSGASYDLVSLFARSVAALSANAPAAIAATKPQGALWIMWIKKSSPRAADLDRDTLWPLIEPLGWGPVASISVDDDWSALRFRPENAIERKSR